jgi:hypothetical protein
MTDDVADDDGLSPQDLQAVAQARLASRVAHRFNNVFATGMANLELALDDLKRNGACDGELIQAAFDSMARGVEICKILQDFARPPHAEPYAVDAGAAVADVVAELGCGASTVRRGEYWCLAEESELRAALLLLARAGPAPAIDCAIGPDDRGVPSVCVTVAGALPPRPDVGRPFEPGVPNRDGDKEMALVWAKIRRAGGRMAVDEMAAGLARATLYFAQTSAPDEITA